ncbi:MAG: hypothetical protein DBX47_04795 [Clostridiales bacterium]|nr:MAG: hypothetical protein DBX47_04795 [Clostridiales bacterium]
MLSIYDLYDLSAIYRKIRLFPEYELNDKILLGIIDVLENEYYSHEVNQFRNELRTIKSLDKEIYPFVWTDNIYVYIPSFMKDKNIYNILIKCTEQLLRAVEQKNNEKIEDITGFLHNLPILVANSNFAIPRSFWKSVKYYRKKWNNDFLKGRGFKD